MREGKDAGAAKPRNIRQEPGTYSKNAMPGGAIADAPKEGERCDAHSPGLAGWGQTYVPGYEDRSEVLENVTRGSVLSRGLGRSYGDSSLPPKGTLRTAGTQLADRFLEFNEQTGVLRAEAGLSLYEMNRLLLPRRWFTPVTPGTQFVTLGGMVASDVHGKNHHQAGCIGRHVRSLRMQLSDDRVVDCSRERYPDLFRATLGGMGLTGHILEVELSLERVPSPWIYGYSQRLPNIDSLLDGLDETAREWPFTVAWIDSLAGSGRGNLYFGRWATVEEAPAQAPQPKPRFSLPLRLPNGLVNAATVGVFNAIWYWRASPRRKPRVIHPESYFYPLDMLLHWNRAYGSRGVTQYQCVLPKEAGRQPIRDLLALLKRHRTASFLSVIKDCGPEGEGLLSFPKSGISLALDLPITAKTQETVDSLNEVVIANRGRIYLTKDGFTTRRHFEQMEPRLQRFLEAKKEWDPEGRIRSAQSERLMGL
jgi:decaprenylphospho-beta-D-ribofuranose 2-oxidase